MLLLLQLRGFAAFPGRACLFDLGLRPLLVVPVRGRKSRNDPPAKSKAGRINKPQPMDATEHLVLRHRYQMYRQIVEALRAEFKANILQELYMKKFGEVEQQKKQDAELEHRQLMEWNDAENRRLQAIREERLRQAEMAKREYQLQVAQSRAVMEEAVQKEREKEVLQLQEEAKNFITPENLDKRIEECLDNPKNYNFAIDKEGRIAKRTVLF